MLEHPQPMRTRATLHPNVPLPNNKIFWSFKISKLIFGCSLHFINLRLRSTALDARQFGSIDADKSIFFVAGFPLEISHPVPPRDSSTPSVTSWILNCCELE